MEENFSIETKVVIAGDSLLSGIPGKEISKSDPVKNNNVPGGTSETVVENLDSLIRNKPYRWIVHPRINHITNENNLLNIAKKIVKKVRKVFLCMKIAFSSIVLWNDKKNIDKKISETNYRLTNYYKQKNINFIENTKIKEEKLISRKLCLNKRGNSASANICLKYISSTFSVENTHSYCVLNNNKEYKSKLAEPICFNEGIKDVPFIVLVHLNINSLQNRFDNVDVLELSETSPVGQFKIPGNASPFRLDQNCNGGGIVVYVPEDIPVKFS